MNTFQYESSWIVNYGKSFFAKVRKINYNSTCCHNINNIGRKLLLGLPQKQNGHPIGCITLPSLISPSKCGVQHLWRLIYGLLTMAVLVGPLISVKDPSKVWNQQVAKSRIVCIPILILIKKFIPWQLIHGCRYCSINNNNELCLLVSTAWVKKELTGGQISSKKQYTGSN